MLAGADADPDAISGEEATLITDLDPVELAGRPELAHDDGTYSRVECEDLARQLGVRRQDEPRATGLNTAALAWQRSPDSAVLVRCLLTPGLRSQTSEAG